MKNLIDRHVHKVSAALEDKATSGDVAMCRRDFAGGEDGFTLQSRHSVGVHDVQGIGVAHLQKVADIGHKVVASHSPATSTSYIIPCRAAGRTADFLHVCHARQRARLGCSDGGQCATCIPLYNNIIS